MKNKLLIELKSYTLKSILKLIKKIMLRKNEKLQTWNCIQKMYTFRPIHHLKTIIYTFD